MLKIKTQDTKEFLRRPRLRPVGPRSMKRATRMQSLQSPFLHCRRCPRNRTAPSTGATAGPSGITDRTRSTTTSTKTSMESLQSILSTLQSLIVEQQGMARRIICAPEGSSDNHETFETMRENTRQQARQVLSLMVETPFINKVASYVNNQAVTQDSKVIEASLSILENIVLNSNGKCGLVEKEVTFPNLVMHLQNINPQIQQNDIALINALFLKVDLAKRRAVAATLQSKQVRNVFLTNVIKSIEQVRSFINKILMFL